jgi:hypothetical protein
MYASFFLLLVYRVNVCAMCYSLGAEEERRGGDHEMSRGKKIPNCKNHLLVIWISTVLSGTIAALFHKPRVRVSQGTGFSPLTVRSQNFTTCATILN